MKCFFSNRRKQYPPGNEKTYPHQLGEENHRDPATFKGDMLGNPGDENPSKARCNWTNASNDWLPHEKISWRVKAVPEMTGIEMSNTPPKTNMEPKKPVVCRCFLLFQGCLFRFYVSFRGVRVFPKNLSLRSVFSHLYWRGTTLATKRSILTCRPGTIEKTHTSNLSKKSGWFLTDKMPQKLKISRAKFFRRYWKKKRQFSLWKI